MPRWPERPPVGDPSDPRGFEVLMGRYLEWLAVHHYSPNTIDSARRLLRVFAEWCAERGLVRPVEVTRSTVERYQRWVYHYRRENGRPLGYKTQMGRLTHVRSFFKYLARARYVLYNPASELVLPRKPPRLPVDGFTRAEVEQVLSSVDLSTALGLRDRAMLEVLYSTGIRRMELVRLDLYDLDTERGWVTIRQGKGGKDRMVPIGERALGWTGRYLREARPELVLHADEWAVFVSNRGVRFHAGALTNVVSRLIRASGVRERRGACHLFRHTMATQMLEGGADVRIIQEILGHANLETTEIYTKVSIHHLKKIHDATHPAQMSRNEGVALELAEELAEADSEADSEAD